MVKTYQELIVWQKGMKLAALIYKFTKDFPRDELYGLVSQIRRSAVSIPSNIAEGWARKNTKEFINFLSIANGSVAELQTQLSLSRDLNFGSEELRLQAENLLIEIQKMLPAIVRGLRATNP